MVTEPYRISEASTGFWFGVGLINLRFQESLHVFFHFICMHDILMRIYVPFNQGPKELQGVYDVFLSYKQRLEL